jgi:hypothetical protein
MNPPDPAIVFSDNRHKRERHAKLERGNAVPGFVIGGVAGVGDWLDSVGEAGVRVLWGAPFCRSCRVRLPHLKVLSTDVDNTLILHGKIS